MAERYKYLFIGNESYKKEITVADVDFNKMGHNTESVWNTTTNDMTDITGMIPFTYYTMMTVSGKIPYDERVDIYTRSEYGGYAYTNFSFVITYVSEIDGVKQGIRFFLYENNSLIQQISCGDGNFSFFLASNYTTSRQLLTLRLGLFDAKDNRYIIKDKLNDTFRDYINEIKSLDPNKRYYNYVAPAIGNELRSSHFIISDIPAIENISYSNWDSNSGYLHENSDVFWNVFETGVLDTTLEALTLQNVGFERYYNSGSKIKLGSNFLYREYNGSGAFFNGLLNYDEGGTTRLPEGFSYTINEDNFKITVSIDTNHNASTISFKDSSGNVLDTFSFRYIFTRYNYIGSSGSWSNNHYTDNLFLGRVGTDYYIFGRTCDYSKGFYVKPFKKLSLTVSNLINEATVTEGEAYGYDAVGGEIVNNNTTERGVDELGNEGTWIDTDNDGVVDSFISDRYKSGEGKRGDNDGNKNLKSGDEDVELPSTPIGQPSSSKFVNIFALTQTELNDLSNELMSPDAWRKFKDFFSVNPLDGVYSLHLLPFTIHTSATPHNVQIADWKSNAEYPVATSSYKTLNFGTVTIKETYPTMEFLNYTDVTIKIFLPLIGIKEIDPTLVIGVSTNLTYYCNILTGDILAVLTCDGKPLYNWIGNCMMKIPLSKNDYSQAISSAISSVTSLGTSAVGFATDNPMLGVSGLISAGDSFVKATKPQLLTSGTLSGNASFFTSKQPFYIVSRNTVNFDDKFNHDFGRHIYKRHLIGDLKGFTKIVDVDLDNLTCTEQEKDEIRNLLRDGVYV